MRDVYGREWCELADVLLMAKQRGTPNEIHVRVRRADGALLNGAAIHWTEDGIDRGGTDSSEGHMTLHPASPTSIVEVKVSYDGKVQSRKLAVDQTICDFSYNDVLPPAPAGPPVSGALPVNVPLWRNPAVVAAIIALIGTILVGWWQFGPRFTTGPVAKSETVTLIVYVKDDATGVPVPRAKVTLQSSAMPAPKFADDYGRAEFQLAKGKDSSLDIGASAQGYDNATLAIRELVADRQVELPMRKVRVTAPPVTPPSGPKPAAAAPSGTWQVQISGDPALKRIQSGTFDFAPVPDGRFTVRGRFVLEGAAVELDGTASRQNNRVFVQFKAQTEARTWNGEGQFDLKGNEMLGTLTDAQRQAVGVTLRKP